MKNRLLLSACLAISLATATRAADGETTSIKFSDPSKPGKLRVNIGHGDLRVRGVDSNEITVKSDAKAVTVAPRKDGLRVLTASSSFGFSEKENVVNLDSSAVGWKGGGSDFDVTVPLNTNLVVTGSTGGDIEVTDVTGDVEITSFHGEITLEGLGGGAQVATLNGEIRASFAKLPENKPISFASTNGEIVIRIPGDAKANVRLRTQNGTILTDFDDKALITKTESLPNTKSTRNRSSSRSSSTEAEFHAAVREAAQAASEAAAVASKAVRAAVAEVRAGSDEYVPRAPMPPMPPMTGGKLVSGTLNGGGPEIILTAVNGDVVLRKFDPKK